jgi:Holliday junction resolvase RusA-like endonuclease
VTSIEFAVRGLPIAQGTARAFVAGGRARIATDANRSNSPIGAWRGAIASACSDAMGSSPALTGPVVVSAWFVFPRPGAHFLPANRSRLAPELRLDAPRYVERKPDLDKLSRALLDGITNVAIRDDAQVARLNARKVYEDDELRPGCTVRIAPIEQTR